MAVTKRKRTPKTSKGIHGATKHPLTPLQAVLAGKGAFAALVPVECKNPWRGMSDPAKPLFNAEQAALNKRLYPHLFGPEGRR